MFAASFARFVGAQTLCSGVVCKGVARITWGRGGIGRRRGLKILRRKACGFEPRRPYHSVYRDSRCGVRTGRSRRAASRAEAAGRSLRALPQARREPRRPYQQKQRPGESLRAAFIFCGLPAPLGQRYHCVVVSRRPRCCTQGWRPCWHQRRSHTRSCPRGTRSRT